MTVLPGDLIQVTWVYSMPLVQLANNVFKFRYDGVSAIADQDVVDDFAVWATSLALIWAGVSSPTATIESIIVSQLVGTELVNIGGALIGQAGVGSGDMLSHGASNVARVKLAKGKGQGRKFWAGMTETQQAESVINAGAMAVYIMLGSLYGDLVDSANFPGVVNTYQPGTFRQDLSTPFREFLNTPFISNIIGYQRRRKPGVGS